MMCPHPALAGAAGGVCPVCPPTVSDDEIRERLLRTKQGDPRNVPCNIEDILCLSEAFADNVCFNQLTKEVELTGGPFSDHAPSDLPVAIANHLGREWGLHASARQVGEQLLYVARRCGSYDPVRGYLESLTWDGTPRIDRWLEAYCQAVLTDDSGADVAAYVRLVGARFLISAVARGLKPGAKVDTVLVLEGAQGIRKSTALEILGGGWYSDTSLKLGDSKDALMVAGAKWIVELAELASIRHSETEAQKAFLSARQDSFRPPYGRTVETFPRRCVFAGTVNPKPGEEAQYLIDETGNRRWWSVKVRMVDVEALKSDRDQLWAEAVARYRTGERWWFEPEEQLIADRVAASRRIESPWVEPIRAWWSGLQKEMPRERPATGWPAAAQDFFTMAEVADGALGIRTADLPRHTKAIANALAQAGFVRAPGQRTHKGRARIRGYAPAAPRGS